MKVLFLFNKVHTKKEFEEIARGESHDNHLYGMLRVRNHGIDSSFLQIEQFIPASFARFLRKTILTMHFAHVPLFPLFFRYDVIFSSTAYGSLILWALWPFKKPKWVILDFNLSGTIGSRQSMREKVFGWAVSRASGVVTISEAERVALGSMFPALACNIIFLHEGTDTKFFQSTVVPEGRTIISAGMHPARDFRTLIEATQDMGVRVILATKTSIATALGQLPEHVSVKQFELKEMADAYARASIAYVGLRLYPGGPYDSLGTFSVIEPMSVGRPVIATDTLNMHSYIENGETGVLVPEGDSVALRAAIEGLLADPARQVRIGLAARERSVTAYDSDIFARNLATYLGKLLEK